MAPQPLLKVRSGISCDFNIHLMGAKPPLSTIVQAINSVYASIDHLWAITFIDLMHADPTAGYEIYRAITSADAKRAAINAAAFARLSKDDYLLFQAVSKAVAPQRRVRNEFAHHLWGTSDSLPDTLLLADPAIFAEREAATKVINKGMARTRRIQPPPPLDYSKVQVFTRAELGRTHRDAEEARFTVIELSHGLHFGEGTSIVESERKRLLARPLVSQALQSLSRQNAPKAQTGSPTEAPLQKR